jgi:Na+/melibiose symporter-like transporter
VAILVSALPALLGSVLVPVIGFHSDRTRSRWGRRLPFLMVMMPVSAASMIALGYCTALGALTDRLLGGLSPGLDACALFWFCLFWTLFEATVFVTLGLYSGLVNDVIPRPILGRFYAGFRIVSLGAGVLFNLWIFHLTSNHLREVFLGIGLFFGLACMLMCTRIREGEYEAAPAPAREPAWQALGSMARTYWRECFTDRYYLMIFSTLMAAELAFVPFNTFYQFYAESLGMDKAMLGRLLATSYLISIGLSFVIGYLVDRYSAALMSLISMVLYLGVSAVGFAGVDDQASFALLYIAHVVVSGAYYTAAASLPMVLFPRARFLQFDAGKRLFNSAGTILLSFLLGPLLDWSGHRYQLTLLAGTLTAACALLGGWAIWKVWGERTRKVPVM